MKKDIINHNKKARGLTKISDDITDMTQKLLGSRGFIEIDILKNWDKIVGNELSQNTLPQKIDFKKGMREEGTLYLITSSGAFALEIAHRQELIIEKINTYFGYKAVSQIKIMQTGEIPLKEEQAKPADIEKKILVSEAEQNYIDTITSSIKDTELKDRLASLAKSIFATQKKEN